VHQCGLWFAWARCLSERERGGDIRDVRAGQHVLEGLGRAQKYVIFIAIPVGLGGSLIVWGYMGPQGLKHRCMIDGRMDAELHTVIHQAEFLARVVFYRMGMAELIF
jgi:hypothetical protein